MKLNKQVSGALRSVLECRKAISEKGCSDEMTELLKEKEQVLGKLFADYVVGIFGTSAMNGQMDKE
jgi:hypothetical protein